VISAIYFILFFCFIYLFIFIIIIIIIIIIMIHRLFYFGCLAHFSLIIIMSYELMLQMSFFLLYFEKMSSLEDNEL